jgi:hypothetical protein
MAAAGRATRMARMLARIKLGTISYLMRIVVMMKAWGGRGAAGWQKTAAMMMVMIQILREREQAGRLGGGLMAVAGAAAVAGSRGVAGEGVDGGRGAVGSSSSSKVAGREAAAEVAGAGGTEAGDGVGIEQCRLPLGWLRRADHGLAGLRTGKMT